MLRPVDSSRSAVWYREQYGVNAPDFEIDVILVVPGVGEDEQTSRSAYVQARIHVGDPIADDPSEIPHAKIGEPTFILHVIPVCFGDASFSGRYFSNYWIALSRLFKYGWASTRDPQDLQLFIPEQTRLRMLVWWDEHSDEVEARVAGDPPSDAEIERHLARARLSFTREEDWWNLGNDLYLMVDDDYESFTVLRRGEDEIEEPTPGLSLLEAIDWIVELLPGRSL